MQFLGARSSGQAVGQAGSGDPATENGLGHFSQEGFLEEGADRGLRMQLFWAEGSRAAGVRRVSL